MDKIYSKELDATLSELQGKYQTAVRTINLSTKGRDGFQIACIRAYADTLEKLVAKLIGTYEVEGNLDKKMSPEEITLHKKVKNIKLESVLITPEQMKDETFK